MNRALIVCVAAVILSGTLGCRQEPAYQGSTEVTLKTCGFEGVESAIDAAKGKVVLIDCWATSCGPCVESFPQLVAKHKKYAAEGLVVISLSLDDDSNSEKVLAFLKKKNATFTNLLLKDDRSSGKGLADKLKYGGSIPHTVLFDRSGRLAWAGHPEDPALQRTLQAELNR